MSCACGRKSAKSLPCPPPHCPLPSGLPAGRGAACPRRARGCHRTGAGDGGLHHWGNPTPLPCWSPLCPGRLWADPTGRARQALPGVLPSLAHLPCSSPLSYLFSRGLSHSQHPCIPGHGCALRPGAGVGQRLSRVVQPSLGCSVSHGWRVGERFSWPLCLLQTLLGATSLGTSPQPHADTRLPTTHTHPEVLPHRGGGLQHQCAGVRAGRRGILGKRGARGVNQDGSSPCSPPQPSSGLHVLSAAHPSITIPTPALTCVPTPDRQ